MKILSRPFNGNNYWNKKGYQLLDGAAATTKRRNMKVVKITSNNNNMNQKRKKIMWRIRRAPKVVIAVASPKRLWGKLRDAYVSMMLKMAGQVGQINAGPDLQGINNNKKIELKRGTSTRSSSSSILSSKTTKSQRRLEEFEARLVLEIYKALSTSRGLSEAVI